MCDSIANGARRGVLAGDIIQPFTNLYVSNSVTASNLYGNLSYLANNGNYLRLFADGTLAFPNNRIDVAANSLTVATQNPSGFTWDWNDGAGSLTEVNVNSGGVNFDVATPSLTSRWYFNPDGSTTLPANLYVANALTTTNATITGTLGVDGAMTSNAANTTFYYDTFTIPYINTQLLNVTAVTGLSSVNLVSLNVQSLFANTATIYGANTLNVLGISNLNSLVTPKANVGTLNVGTVSNLANLAVSNTVTTTNIVAAGFTSNSTNTVFNFDTLTIPFINSTTLNVASTSNLSLVSAANVIIGSGVTTVQANLHIEQGDVFIGNSAITGSNFTTTGPINRIVFDNSANTTVIPNRIVLFSNAAGGIYAGFGVGNATGGTTIDVQYRSRSTHVFYTGSGATTEHSRFSSSGALIVGGTVSNAKLYVTGSFTGTNIMARIDSSNIALVSNGGGLIGINTLTPTANLHVLGNVYVSNALQTTNVFTSNIVYSLDLIAQGPYLNPSTANASIVTQWYSRLVNTTSGPFWSVAAAPQFSYINTSNLTGYYSQTLLNDGRVLFNQIGGTNIGFFYPQTNQFSYVTGVSINGFDYSGVLQIPDGRVVFVPCNGNKVGLLNPSNYTLSTVSTGTALNNMHYGAVYEPSGNVIMTPTNSSNVGIFNTNTGAYSRVAFSSEVAINTILYYGSVLLPDGRVVFIPNGTSNVGIYTPSTATYSNVTVTVSGKYAGGCLMPDGNVFMVPNLQSSNACIYNPNLNTLSNVTGLNGVVIGGGGNAAGAVALPDGRIVITPSMNNSGGGFIIYNYKTGTYAAISGLSGGIMFQNSSLLGGGTLLPDGRIIFTTTYGAGLLNFRTPVPIEFCLHPFFNKF